MAIAPTVSSFVRTAKSLLSLGMRSSSQGQSSMSADVTISMVVTLMPTRPDRVACVERMLGKMNLSELVSYKVIHAEGKHPWHTGKRAWEWLATQNSTHSLVIQDDVKICEDYLETLKKVIAYRPDDLIGGMMFKRKNLTPKLMGGVQWVKADTPCGQAIVIPTNQIQTFLDWIEAHCPQWTHSDSVFGMWLGWGCTPKRFAWTPTPTLVDHDSSFESTMPRNGKGKFRGTLHSPRFLGENVSGLTRDFSDMTSFASYAEAHPDWIKAMKL